MWNIAILKNRKNNFLPTPAFPGGKKAYPKFIKDNIIYTEQALVSKIEGNVYAGYTVNNIGETPDFGVTKGIGYGCEEETIRVIRLLVYEPARYCGVKMKIEMKTMIILNLRAPLHIPETEWMRINYIFADVNNLVLFQKSTLIIHIL